MDEIDGRLVPKHNFHLTLVFLGNQDAQRIAEIQSIGDAVSGRPFNLSLDRWGYFEGPRVLWLGAIPPLACVALADGLSSSAGALGLEFQRRSFVPHLTVFRRVASPPKAFRFEPIKWTVRDFSLIESIPEKPYQLLRTWSLK